MIRKLSALLLSISIVVMLSACGSDEAVENSASPINSPLVEASAAPVITEAPEPTSTPAASATAKAASTAKPTPSPKSTKAPKPSDTNNGEAAAALFKQSCTSCHGVDLAGDFGPNLQKIGGKLTKAQITTQITNGGDAMPSFQKSLKADEIQILAAWLAAKK